MANFNTPFAETGPRRNPTSEERANGFPCGGADQSLFNGMFHRIEAELGEIITFAGLTPTDAQFNQVRLAIQAMIAAATGEGETDGFLLVSQAASRLPIFPEILTGDGRITITSPGGGVARLPGGITFLHRGIDPHVTVQTDFNMVASKTYHLRWNPTDGFTLKDVANAIYNPGTLADDNIAFDSTYDDMLVARIVTNAGNVATFTSLANKHSLRGSFAKTTYQSQAGSTVGLPILQENLNWARTPQTFVIHADGEYSAGVDAIISTHTESTRYVTKGWTFSYGNANLVAPPPSYQSGQITVGVTA